MNSTGKWSPSWLLRAYLEDERGAAAAELALWFIFLTVPILNVVDGGFYIFKTMQVRESAQAGAQTAESACGYLGKTPAATSCGLTTNVLTNAIHSTSLGANVCLGDSTMVNSTTGACIVPATSGTPTEGWYCNDTSGALVLAKPATSTWAAVGGTATAQPSDCTATVTGDADAPGDYVAVTASYKYTPLFTAVSLINLLRQGSIITQTAYMRIN